MVVASSNKFAAQMEITMDETMLEVEILECGKATKIYQKAMATKFVKCAGNI